jgi:hypothetical protein
MLEAELGHKAAMEKANERHLALLKTKAQVLQQVRELMFQCDQTMKSVTVAYFQLQHSITAPSPVQVVFDQRIFDQHICKLELEKNIYGVEMSCA